MTEHTNNYINTVKPVLCGLPTEQWNMVT